MCLRSIDKFALCALFCGAFTSGAFAYPSNPVLRTVDNDGDSLSIRTIGDEHYRFTQTEDGFLVGNTATSWSTAWYIFAAFALVVAVSFMFLFKYKHVRTDNK